MAGLSLGVYGASRAGTMPYAAGVSPGAPTISQMAFGTYSQNSSVGARTAGFGTVALGLIGAGVLVWLWYSLPR